MNTQHNKRKDSPTSNQPVIRQMRKWKPREKSGVTTSTKPDRSSVLNMQLHSPWVGREKKWLCSSALLYFPHLTLHPWKGRGYIGLSKGCACLGISVCMCVWGTVWVVLPVSTWWWGKDGPQLLEGSFHPSKIWSQVDYECLLKKLCVFSHWVHWPVVSNRQSNKLIRSHLGSQLTQSSYIVYRK